MEAIVPLFKWEAPEDPTEASFEATPAAPNVRWFRRVKRSPWVSAQKSCGFSVFKGLCLEKMIQELDG